MLSTEALLFDTLGKRLSNQLYYTLNFKFQFLHCHVLRSGLSYCLLSFNDGGKVNPIFAKQTSNLHF